MGIFGPMTVAENPETVEGEARAGCRLALWRRTTDEASPKFHPLRAEGGFGKPCLFLHKQAFFTDDERGPISGRHLGPSSTAWSVFISIRG
jgi:hypothetical protein